MWKTDAWTRVRAHTHTHTHALTSEIHFSVQILDLRGQAELEQVQAGKRDRDRMNKDTLWGARIRVITHWITPQNIERQMGGIIKHMQGNYLFAHLPTQSEVKHWICAAFQGVCKANKLKHCIMFWPESYTLCEVCFVWYSREIIYPRGTTAVGSTFLEIGRYNTKLCCLFSVVKLMITLLWHLGVPGLHGLERGHTQTQTNCVPPLCSSAPASILPEVECSIKNKRLRASYRQMPLWWKTAPFTS